MPCASRAFFPTCLLPCTRRSHGRHSPRFACLLALFTLARIACLLHICVKTSRFRYSIWATPIYKHPYFRVCKLGVGKVINRLSILYTINNGSVQNFRIFFSNHEARFEEILGLSIKYFVINRKIGLDGVDKNEG